MPHGEIHMAIGVFLCRRGNRRRPQLAKRSFEGIGDLGAVALRVLARVLVPQPGGHRYQAIPPEGLELQLGLALAGEAAVGGEFDAIVWRGQAGHALARVEELGGAGHRPQQAREVPGGVDELSQAIERFLARVATSAQDRLGLRR